MAGIEFVWVVRRRDLFPDGSPQGFHPLPIQALEDRFLQAARCKGFFVERREAEHSPEWKQVIPYCLVRSQGAFLLFERLAAQGEARLHGKLSIGVGGHIEPCDAGRDPILAAAQRELAEELELPGPCPLQPLGLLNDDRDPVGSVHVGVVFATTLPRRPRIRETDKMRGRWTPLEELRDLCQTSARFESWSSAILRTPGWETGFLRHI